MRARIFRWSLIFLIGSGSAAWAQPPRYLLSLGDSLAASIQPNLNGEYVETNQGYAEYLYAFYRPRIDNLRLKKLGCSGETTHSMIYGGTCSYRSGNQLDEAIAFLATHDVALVTLDIGADNLLGCLRLGQPDPIDEVCVASAFAAIGGDLPVILNALRTAAPHVRIVGMNYYDPFQAAWIFGAQGQALAQASLVITINFNTALESVYQSVGIPVADVARAFRITNTTLVPIVNVPVNVLTALAWTWMGARPPIGPDVHPNSAGYAVIAWAFVRTIESS